MAHTKMLAPGVMAFLVAVANTTKCCADDAPGKLDSKIAHWISELDSDHFNVRARATAALKHAGVRALPAVIEATRSESLEVKKRALKVLFVLFHSPDAVTAKATLSAMLKSKDARERARVQRWLDSHALAAVLAVGARFDKSDSVNFTNTKVTDADLAFLPRFPHLRVVNLHGTQITDAGLKHLQGLTKLEELYLTETATTDAGLKHLQRLVRLRSLFLRDTKITDEGLKHLQAMENLYQLRLQRTAITDAGLAHLADIKSLKLLFLDETRVSDGGMKHLKGLTRMAQG